MFKTILFKPATLCANSVDDKLMILFLIFPRKGDLTFHANLSPLEAICMKCQNLFSGENNKNISIHHLLKALRRVLSTKRKVCFCCLPDFLKHISDLTLNVTSEIVADNILICLIIILFIKKKTRLGISCESSAVFRGFT